ncbi:MAG: phage tail protein [Desulfobacterales bacterium]|nr:phage tail protein [Desulfobacterales bacterium]
MGLFFDYFRKTLRFPLIWKDGYLSILVKGASLTLDQIRQEIIDFREQAMPETCDVNYLSTIGQGRGVRQWPYEPDDFYRSRVSRAYSFFQMGGKRSGVEEILRLAGIEVAIYEPRDIRAALSQIGTPVLDGSWHLDGSTQLKSVPEMVSMPYLSWAEFLIRINLATMTDPQRTGLMKKLVYEYKPARSLPKFSYWLEMETSVETELDAQNAVVKDSDCYPLTCTPLLDGSWKVGRDAENLKLDGTWAVDGFFRLGQELMPAVAMEKISNCRHVSDGYGASIVEINAGVPEQPGTVPYFSLSTRIRRLDGSWYVGSYRHLDGTWSLGWDKTLDTPRLGICAEHQLKSKYKVGYRDPESVSWPRINGGIYGKRDIN